MTPFQVAFVPLCALIALASLARTARGRVSVTSGLLLTAAWTAAAVLIAWPALTTIVASWLGIGRGADFVFYLAILGGLLVAIFFYSRFRQLEVMITELFRRQALVTARRSDSPQQGEQAGQDSVRGPE